MADNMNVTVRDPLAPRRQMPPIVIGRAGEYGATTVTFDLRGFIDRYGAGVPTLLHKRPPDDEAYIVPPSAADTETHDRTEMPDSETLVWHVGQVATSYVGNGTIELQWRLPGTTSKKTAQFDVVVLGAIGNPVSEIPNAQQIYLDVMQGIADDAEDAADRAEAATEHYPKIVNGNWYVWDAANSEWVNTGVSARGPAGDTGDSAYEEAVAHGFVGTEEEWLASLKGEPGANGRDGQDGAPGAPGTPGRDGVSPTVQTEPITGGNRVTITDKNGPKEFEVDDGVSPSITVADIEGGHRVNITDKTHPNGQNFDVMDGADYVATNILLYYHSSTDTYTSNMSATQLHDALPDAVLQAPNGRLTLDFYSLDQTGAYVKAVFIDDRPENSTAIVWTLSAASSSDSVAVTREECSIEGLPDYSHAIDGQVLTKAKDGPRWADSVPSSGAALRLLYDGAFGPDDPDLMLMGNVADAETGNAIATALYYGRIGSAVLVDVTDPNTEVVYDLFAEDYDAQTHVSTVTFARPEADCIRTATLSGSTKSAPTFGTIPLGGLPAVTEQTVANWGFTKNTGTYSKPSGGIPDSDIASAATWNSKGTYSKPSTGIPKSDLASDVQTSLGKADTALQQHQSLAGYATESYVQTRIANIPDELPAVTASDNGKVLGVVNGAWAVKSDEGGSSVTVDDALSTTSENPVQNKVVKAALNAKADVSALNGKQDALTAGQNVTISGNTISADVDSAEIASNVTNWLNTNVNPVGSAVVVDSSLSVSGAAADAKKAGDYIRRLNSVNFVESKNLFNAEFVNGRISGGAFTPLSTGVSHIAEEEYIPVDGGEKYTLSFIAGKSYINLYISGYDASKAPIENAFSSVFVGVKETAFSTLLNVPAGCSYVRFSAYRDQEPYENMIPTNIQLEKGTVATEYESPDGGGAIIPQLQEELDEVKGNVSVQSVNMLDVVFTNSRVISGGTYQTLSTGTTHASHAELIEVEPSAEYVMSWIPTDLMIHCYVYEYNSNNGYLTYTHFSTNRDTPARAENSFTVGNTTKYIRIDFYRESVAWQELIPEELQLQIGHVPTDYEEAGEIFAVPVLEKKVAELDGGYLPNYYEAYLPAKIDQIKTLLKSSVVNGDAFYFITDMHWDKNAQNSPAIIKRMNKELRIDKLFTGGDITPNGYADQPVNKLMDAMGGKDMVYGINGNHEFLDDATYADIFYMQSAVLPNDVVFGSTEKNYYYFDNRKQKIRYIVLAAFGEAVNGAAVSLYTDADQLAWLTNTALNVESGWTIIILTHSYYSSPYNGGSWGGANQESPPQTDHGFTNAIRDYVQNGDGEIACIITGHLHYDRIFENEGMPKVVAVTCDKYAPWIENGTDREPWLAERVPGTVTEQAFDVVVLDKTARTVKFVRVGGDAYDGINGSFGNAVQIRTISY